MALVLVYIPPTGRGGFTVAKREEAVGICLTRAEELREQGWRTVIAGDWNIDLSGVHRHDSAQQRRLDDITQRGWLRVKPNEEMPTFLRIDGDIRRESKLDHVLACARIWSEEATDLEIDPTAMTSVGTDHAALCLSVRCPWGSRPRRPAATARGPRTAPRYQYPRNPEAWQKWKEATQKVDQDLGRLPWGQEAAQATRPQITEALAAMTRFMQRHASRAFDRVGTNRRPPSQSAEVHRARAARNEAERRWRGRRRVARSQGQDPETCPRVQEALHAFVEARNKAKHVARGAIVRRRTREAQRIEAAAPDTARQHELEQRFLRETRVVNPRIMRDPENPTRLLREPREILDMQADFAEATSRYAPPANPEARERAREAELTVDAALREAQGPFTPTFEARHIKAAIKSLRRRAAPGSDGIATWMLADAHENLIKRFTHILRAAQAQGFWPAQLLDGEVSYLPKTGKGRDPKSIRDHRPITVLPAMGKVLERILLDGIEPRAEREGWFSDQQTGFRPHRRHTDNLIWMRELAAKRLREGRETWLITLDIDSAYDRIHRVMLMERLVAKGVRGWQLHLAAGLLSGRGERRVRLGNRLSRAIADGRGVPQGALNSPTLFNIAIDEIVRAAQAACGRAGAGEGPMVVPGVGVFADDMAVIADSPRQAQLILDVLGAEARTRDVRFKGAKSVAIRIGPTTTAPTQSPRQEELSIQGEPIPVREEARFLGMFPGKVTPSSSEYTVMVAAMRKAWEPRREAAKYRAPHGLHLDWTSTMEALAKRYWIRAHEYMGGLCGPGGHGPHRIAHIIRTYLRPIMESFAWLMMIDDPVVRAMERAEAAVIRRMLCGRQSDAGRYTANFLYGITGLIPFRHRYDELVLRSYNRMAREAHPPLNGQPLGSRRVAELFDAMHESPEGTFVQHARAAAARVGVQLKQRPEAEEPEEDADGYKKHLRRIITDGWAEQWATTALSHSRRKASQWWRRGLGPSPMAYGRRDGSALGQTVFFQLLSGALPLRTEFHRFDSRIERTCENPACNGAVEDIPHFLWACKDTENPACNGAVEDIPHFLWACKDTEAGRAQLIENLDREWRGCHQGAIERAVQAGRDLMSGEIAHDDPALEQLTALVLDTGKPAWPKAALVPRCSSAAGMRLAAQRRGLDCSLGLQLLQAGRERRKQSFVAVTHALAAMWTARHRDRALRPDPARWARVQQGPESARVFWALFEHRPYHRRD